VFVIDLLFDYVSGGIFLAQWEYIVLVLKTKIVLIDMRKRKESPYTRCTKWNELFGGRGMEIDCCSKYSSRDEHASYGCIP